MAFEVGSIIARIKADVTDFKKGISEAQKHTKGLKDRMDAAKGGSIALLGAVTAVAAGAVAFGVASVSAFNEAAEAEAKLIQLHHKNTGATMAQVEELKNLASEVQAYGVIGDDAIITGQAQLSTFKLSTDAIKSLTPAMADMVAHNAGVNATGEDFVNIGNLMGKVMEGNIGALGRYGVSFSDAQEEVLKTGTETERAATLAEVLEANYGGVNEALRETFQGRMQAAKNTFGDFMEVIGRGITEYIGPFIDRLNDWMDALGGPEGMMKALIARFQELAPWLPVIIGAIMVGLVPALWAAAAGMWALFAPLIPFLAVGAALGLLFKALKDRGINPLTAVLGILKQAWDFLRPSVEALWNTISKNLIPTLQALWARIQPVLIPVLKVLAAIVGGVLIGAIWVAINVLNIIIGVVSTVIGVFMRMQDWAWKATKGIRDAFGRIVGSIKSALSGVWAAITEPFDKALNAVKDKVDSATKKLKDLNPFQRHSPSLYDLVSRGTDAVQREFEQMYSGIKNATIPATSPAITAGFGAATMDPGAMAGAMGGSQEYHIHIDGVLARSREDVREIGKDIVEAINEEKRAKGQTEIGGR